MTTKYINSTPHSSSIQYTIPANPNKDFVMYVEQYTPQQTVNVEGIPSDKVPFFNELIKNLYHIVYAPATAHTDVAYGSGNYQLVKFNRQGDGQTYHLEMYGIRVPRIVYAINEATLDFSTDNSIKFSSNTGFSITISKSGDMHNFGDVILELWQITLTVNNKVLFRYQAIPLQM